ncbi:MAG: cytochrome c, partial [Bryobacteraceae bacterium]
SSARRVFPAPPGPVSVSSRVSGLNSKALTSASCRVRPTKLVGGVGSIRSSKPIKTVGSYWPYATTVFDYVRRAMPYDQPGSLAADQVYAAVAFILHANGIIGENDEMNRTTLPKVRMPNRDGFIPDARPDVKSKP